MSNTPTQPRPAFGYSTEERNTIAGPSSGLHPTETVTPIPNAGIPDPETYNLEQLTDYSRRVDDNNSTAQLTDPDEFHAIDSGYEMGNLGASAPAQPRKRSLSGRGMNTSGRSASVQEAPVGVGGWGMNTSGASPPRSAAKDLPAPVTQQQRTRARYRGSCCTKRVFWSWMGVGIFFVVVLTGAALGLTLGKSKQQRTASFVPQATTFKTVGAGPPKATATMTQYRG